MSFESRPLAVVSSGILRNQFDSMRQARFAATGGLTRADSVSPSEIDPSIAEFKVWIINHGTEAASEEPHPEYTTSCPNVLSSHE